MDLKNITARLGFCVYKSTHITSILMKLHWLPVCFNLIKILLHVFKRANGVLPSYLDDLICEHRFSCYLHSSMLTFFCFLYFFQIWGDHRFDVCGPLIWNNLPASMDAKKLLSSFKFFILVF